MNKAIRIFGFSLIAFLLSSLVTHAQSVKANKDPLAKTVTVNYTDIPLKTVLNDLTKKSGMSFSYSRTKISVDRKITLEARNIRISELLDELFELTGIKYELVGNQVVLSPIQKENLEAILKSLLKEKYTISGYIKDAKSGEALIGANVYFPKLRTGVTTNLYGFYSISLALEDSLGMRVTYIGYVPQHKILNLNEDINLDINLELSAYELEEVVIDGSRNAENVESTQMGIINIPIQAINSMPVIFGERDPLKLIQLLPGVQSGNEGTTGFHVRGGAADQNLVILDDAIVYNPNHIFGLFSTFNTRAISKMTLVKGGFSAKYGGRLSSILDISMKEGDMRKVNVDGGISLITAGVTVDGPIVKDKSSFILSVRRSYIDLIIKQFLSKKINAIYYFYDINAKVNHKFSDKDRVYLSFFTGRDLASYTASSSLNYDHKFGNTTGTLRWNHLFNKKLFANTSLVFNNYELEVLTKQSGSIQQIFTGIDDLTAKMDFDYYPSSKHWIKFGAIFSDHSYAPTSNVAVGDSLGVSVIQEKNVSDGAIYFNDEYDISPRLGINVGVRTPFFKKKNTEYFRVEPRITMKFGINASTSVKASYTKMNQFVNLVPNSTASIPTDIFIPSSDKVKPQVSQQVSAGLFKNFRKNAYETSVELYYKTMRNQVLIQEGVELSTQIEIDDQLTFGKGWSYGAEFFIKKNAGRLNGWISYTISRTWQKFTDLNFGRKFPFRYDRRHNLALVGSYKLNDHWSLAANFIYRTGNAITLPAGRLDINNAGSLYDGYFLEYTSRNSYRMPAYHRLDFSASYKKKRRMFKKDYNSEWVFSIYNAYSRLNTYYIYMVVGADGEPSVNQTSFLPIVPSVTYNFRF